MRVIQHRAQSDPAFCQHRNDVGQLDCVNECQLIITASPLLKYNFLIVDRCPAHLNASYGVDVCAGFEPPVDDEQDCWGAF